MSHRPERKEKDCLNCGTIVQGKYCHICGQENSIPKESFWSMVTHFFNDITHFDGKFFKTMGVLFKRPGYLSQEYVVGRRSRYLNPIRMYIFTSALFFLIIFSLFSTKKIFQGNKSSLPSVANIEVLKDSALARANTTVDSVNVLQAFALFDKANKPKVKDTLSEKDSGVSTRYASIAQYDSIQASLPPKKRDGWLDRYVNHKSIELKIKYAGKGNELLTSVMDKFLHTFPYLLFVSLPLYAFVLYLLYIRRRKILYYADHGIFLVHLYIFTFLIMLLFFLLQKMKIAWGVNLLNLVQAVMLFYGVYYALRAMKNFYAQSWSKTIIKFLIFNLICIIIISFLFAFFFGYSLLQA